MNGPAEVKAAVGMRRKFAKIEVARRVADVAAQMKLALCCAEWSRWPSAETEVGESCDG